MGAGPAGAAAALGALRARPGSRVLLLDRADFPRDKPCGDGIAPYALEELARLGVVGVADDAPEVPLLSLRAPGVALADALVGRQPRPSRVVPRAVFDARLVDAAVAAGAQLVRRRVHRVRQTGGWVEVDDRFAAPVLVAADGASSSVRRALGVRRARDAHWGIAIRGYAASGAGDDARELTLRVDLVDEGWPAYAWSFPLGGGRANVGYGMRRSGRGGVPPGAGLAARLAAALPDQPADPATLRTAPLPFSSGRPRPDVGRVLLAGDAASLVNPLTGEGIFYAVASGRLAGIAAVVAPQNAGPWYRRLLARRLARHLRHTRALAALITSLGMARAALDVSRDPRVFAEISELGLGDGLVSASTVARTLLRYAGNTPARP